jgi:putative ABC transport system substrate-binding protein
MNRFLSKFFFDNRKSAIQNPKWVSIFAIALTFAFGGVLAEAHSARWRKCVSKRIRCFALSVSGILLYALCYQAQAQPNQTARIGILQSGSSSSSMSRIAALREGLRELGYVEGKNIKIDYRYAEGQTDQFAVLAAELIRLKPDVLVTSGSPAIVALMKATTKIPIVMAAIGDAVGNRFVKSLAQPGGNVTGLSFLDPDISTKRLELLKEAIPRVVRVAVLRHVSSGKRSLEATLDASRPLKVQVHVLEIEATKEFDGAFMAAKKGGAHAINVMASPILFAYRKELVDLSAKHRLPGMYENREFVEIGGLLSYGANLDDLYRRAAAYVDKILKGTKPADIPVEQPMKFEFVINLKTAKQIGLTIPPHVLARADKVIK